MTTDLEKQFFDTFGIEPKKQCYYWDCPYSTGDISQDIPMRERKCNKCNNPNKEIYPQITDRILLELIRIIGKKPFGYLQCENTYSTNLGDARDMITVEADSLKEGLLTLAMQNKVVLRIKHQVRTLFEEG